MGIWGRDFDVGFPLCPAIFNCIIQYIKASVGLEMYKFSIRPSECAQIPVIIIYINLLCVLVLTYTVHND